MAPPRAAPAVAEPRNQTRMRKLVALTSSTGVLIANLCTQLGAAVRTTAILLQEYQRHQDQLMRA
jgi:hypothetical protein